MLGRGVIEGLPDGPVAVSGVTVMRGGVGEMVVIDTVRQEPLARRLSESVDAADADGVVTFETTAGELTFRPLRPADADWLTEVKPGPLPVPVLETLIDAIAEVENEGGSPYWRETDWEADELVYEDSGRLCYDVIIGNEVAVRAVREPGRWVQAEVNDPERGHGLPLEFRDSIIDFVDDGLLPTDEILDLAASDPDGEVQVDDGVFVDDQGEESVVVVFMPMDDYLDSELEGIRAEALRDPWRHLDAGEKAIREQALAELARRYPDQQAEAALHWLHWRRGDIAGGQFEQDQLRRWAEGSDEERRQAAAAWETPGYLLRRLARSGDEELLRAIAGNPQAPPGLLWRIFWEHPELREDLADNPGAPADLLVALVRAVIADDPEHAQGTLFRVVRNPTAPEDAVLACLNRRYPIALCTAAQSVSATPAVVARLLEIDAGLVDHDLRNNPRADIPREGLATHS